MRAARLAGVDPRPGPCVDPRVRQADQSVCEPSPDLRRVHPSATRSRSRLRGTCRKGHAGGAPSVRSTRGLPRDAPPSVSCARAERRASRERAQSWDGELSRRDLRVARGRPKLPARAASPEAAREPARRDVWSPERRRLDEPLAAMRRVGARGGQERAPLRARLGVASCPCRREAVPRRCAWSAGQRNLESPIPGLGHCER